jgi:hypothetical protein
VLPAQVYLRSHAVEHCTERLPLLVAEAYVQRRRLVELRGGEFPLVPQFREKRLRLALFPGVEKLRDFLFTPTENSPARANTFPALAETIPRNYLKKVFSAPVRYSALSFPHK